MQIFDHEVQLFYGRKGFSFFEALYQQVNRQALAPFFIPWLRKERWVLDAGSGSGNLAEIMGLKTPYFLDLTWEQLKWCRDKGTPGHFVQGDIQQLPFQDNVFDEVVCSNALHYTGLDGLKELLRVTKPGGQLLLAFLEGSEFTRLATRFAVFWNLFPPLMRDARFIDLEELPKLNIKIVDSATVVYFPPFFQVRRKLPRQGLVAFALEKVRSV
jgi:SAM-dependent methyltransferase